MLAVTTGGDPAGRPVLVHTGTPGSRWLYPPHERDAAERGLLLIGYDRPGYGGSSPHPGRTVADCAGDVRAICAALGIGRLAMWGISGGGPHVLACAALLPDLVAAAASLASPAPYDAEGLDYFAGMGQANVDDIKLFFADQTASRAKLDAEREDTLAAAPDDLAKEMQTLLTPADAAVMAGELAGFFASSMHDSLAPGSEGWWEDNCMHLPWGFELSAISVPVLVMQGRQDMFVPFAHGEWLAGHIPGAEARLLDHDGHLTLMQHRVPEVHAWLARQL
jgi:pimeloyl-ACP methyl ester carboxylesterase